jgi:Undecaprenyl-phosphate glucose phosphotransferase
MSGARKMFDLTETPTKIGHDENGPTWQTSFAPRRRQPLMTAKVVEGLIQMLDIFVIVIIGQIALQFYIGSILGTDITRSQHVIYGLISIAVAMVFSFAMHRCRGYVIRNLVRPGWQCQRIFFNWTITVSVLTMIAFIGKASATYSRGWLVVWICGSFITLSVMRIATHNLINVARRRGLLNRTVAIVGAGEVGEHLIAKIKADLNTEIVIAGVFDDRLTRVPAEVEGYRVLGTTDSLITMIQASLIDEIIIALPLRAADRIGGLIAKLRSLPADLRLSIDDTSTGFPMRAIGQTATFQVIEILDRPLKNWSGITKWLEDRILGTIFLLLVTPLMGLTALAIRLDSKGPAFFVQERFGFNNQPVRVFKFRTMHVNQGDPSGSVRTIRNDPRVTRIGRFLRAVSLDELPQILNVMRGDMSLVGPRPHALTMKAGEQLYHDAVAEYSHRHRVKPGITGWAQIHGHRGEIDSLEKAQQRVAYDLHYIEHWSLWLDLKILLATVAVVVSRNNAY